MRKIVIAVGVLVVGGLVILGFSPKFTEVQLKKELTKSWIGHSERDLEFQEDFYGLAASVAAQNVEVRERFDSYKERLKTADDAELFKWVFLLRRNVDKDSLYAGLEKWNTLSEQTRAVTIANIGPTYRDIVKGSLADNQALVDLLAKRKTNRDAVIAALPASFKNIINQIDPNDVDGYLKCMYLLMLNTVSVMKYIGHTNEKEEL